MSPDRPDPDEARSDAECAALLRRAAAGDRAAFDDLYRRLAPPVMSFLFHLVGDRGLAEDVTQEAFAKAWRFAPRYDPARGAVRTWLFRIAKNHAWSELPRWRRASARGGEAGDLAEAAAGAGAVPARETGAFPGAEGEARRLEAGAALGRAMEALSETLRAAFVLVRVQGRPYAEAAEVLDVPVGTVKSRLAAAEAFLRERLKGVA
jgi:RNA polymerase sigma-70 factor (ECF subfamily)